MKLSDTENTIIDGMARAFFVSAWADKQDMRYSTAKTPRTKPRATYVRAGQDLMDVAPKTPRYARDFALMFAGKLPSLLVAVNDAAWADAMSNACVESPIHRWEHPELEKRVEELKTDEYLRTFGHYLAMQGMGHGVSWFDDHARFEINIPHVEAYI